MTEKTDGGTPESVLIWERPEPESRRAPSPLSREAIVRAAIALADADGLEAVSLRKVGAELDAGPMRLYRYLSTKEELLQLMVDAVYAEIRPAEPLGADWREALRSHAARTRAAALRHEWFADLLGGRPHFGPGQLAVAEAVLAALEDSGAFPDVDRAWHAVNTVDAYLVGAVRKEIGERRAQRADGLGRAEWQHTLGPYLERMFATGRYPAIERLVRDGGDPDSDTVFEAGLAAVLDGVAARFA